MKPNKCNRYCGKCKKPYQIGNHMCYDDKWNLPKLIEGPEKIDNYNTVEFKDDLFEEDLF